MSNGFEQGNPSFSQAQTAMAEAERLINDEAQANPDKKKSKSRTRNILNNVNRVVNVLEHIGEMHPAAKLVFEVYKGLLKLENDRRDNSEQIVILFHSMARMLSVLSYLDQVVLVADDPLTVHLGEVLYASCATMEEFGDLSDLYYNKCKQPIVRFMKAGDFKSKIRDFANRFAQHRTDLQEILVIRNEVRTGEISQGIEDLRANTERIIARLGEPVSEQEAKAIAIVRECGRDWVLHDKAKLEELSGLIGGGKVSGNTQALLESNIDDLLTANMDQFHRKLDSSMSQISESVNKSRDAILKKLDSGPHELIDDPDVKAVWQSNAWKLSVKCRHFVDELSNHYEDKFRNEAALGSTEPNDHWTLPIFSKVMHHPAIGDAIDEDGSGFISLYEVNCWLKERPPGWSVPEWLVYWAIGWKMNNARFNESVVDALDDIKDRCKDIVGSENEDIQHQIQQYLSKIQILESISSWSDNAHAEDTQDLSHEAEAKLQSLLDQSSKEQLALITGRLEELKWILDDPADLPVLLGGSDARIEQVFLSIAHLILGKQLEELATKELHDGDWEIMTETLEMLIAVFHDRMQSLLRGWRAQKLNVELHITCFAGGIYNGWYSAYYNPDGEMKRILEKKPTSEGANSQGSSQADTLATLLTQISNLTERVDHVDSRIDDIFSMLKTLVASSSIQAHPEAPKKANEIRNSLLGLRIPASGTPSAHITPSNIISSQLVQTESPIAQLEEMRKPLQKLTGHGKLAKQMMKVGAAAVKVAANPEDLLDQVQDLEGFNLPKRSLNEGDEFDFIVDGYAASSEAISFPRMEDVVSRIQPPSAAMSPETDQTHALPEHQTPRDYGVSNVMVADRTEPFNDFYNSTFTNVLPLDSEAFRQARSGWSSAGLAKNYVDQIQDQRPMTAPLMSMVDDTQKRLKHKKSGLKGVKDSIRDIGRGTRSRLTSFSSKKSGDAAHGSGESSERNHSMGYSQTISSENPSWTPQFSPSEQRPAYDRYHTEPWDGRGGRPRQESGNTPPEAYRGNSRPNEAPLAMPNSPPQRRPKPSPGPTPVTPYSPSRRMGWTGSTQWEDANATPYYGTAH